MCYNGAMDWTAIIVALIGSAGGCIGAIAGLKKVQKKSEIEAAVREQRQNDRFDRIDEKIERLEKKVDIHNGYAEKFGSIAVSLEGMQKDIEYLKSDRCR